MNEKGMRIGLMTAFWPARMGGLASPIAGCITVGYLTVEIAMIGLVAWPQVVWFLVGLLMIGMAALLWQAESHASPLTGAAAGTSVARAPSTEDQPRLAFRLR